MWILFTRRLFVKYWEFNPTGNAKIDRKDLIFEPGLSQLEKCLFCINIMLFMLVRGQTQMVSPPLRPFCLVITGCMSYTCSLILNWYTKYLFPGLRGAITTCLSVYINLIGPACPVWCCSKCKAISDLLLLWHHAMEAPPTHFLQPVQFSLLLWGVQSQKIYQPSHPWSITIPPIFLSSTLIFRGVKNSWNQG